LRKAIGCTGLDWAIITNTGTLEGGNLSAAIGLVGTSPWIATIINSGVISAGDGETLRSTWAPVRAAS
jgi:hypothetical protein